MSIFYLNLALVYVFSFFARYFSRPQINSVSVNPNRLLIFFSITVLVLVAGLRNNIGDTFFYMHSFEITHFSLASIDFSGDFGFNIYQMVLQRISKDPQILVFVTALITNLLIVIVLYKYSRMIELSIYVYITGGLFLVSMNGIRQCLAAAIAFTATKYLINGNGKRYTLVILLASTFHQSALILLPIYFLARFKAWSKATVALVFLSIIIVVAFDQFSSILFSAIEDTQYGHYESFTEGGANILRVVVDAVPLAIAYLGRDKLRKLFPDSDYFVNMALLGFVFMVISTQNWIFARFSIYFGIYQLVLISWVVKLFRERDQKFVYFGIVLCYFAYYYYENVVSLSIMYESDYLKW